MNLEAASESVIAKEPEISLPFPNRGPWRLLYALYIIILPALVFWTNSLLGPEWQSGKLSDYIKLFLFPKASLIFLILLAYSIICYLLLLIAPDRSARFFPIRFGIYTGTLLALQYSILSVPVLFDTGFRGAFLVVWIFPLVLSVLYRWAAARWPALSINNILFVLIAVVLVVGIWTGSGIFLVLMVFVTSAPFWSFLIGLRATIWLLKNHETRLSLPRGIGLASWFAVYAIAWRFGILKMYELYATLPKEAPPDCYIATAAARGHPRFVCAWTVQRADGKSMQVNRQLQRLKCAELALLAVHPRMHKSLRRIYDVIGRCLARWIQNPFLADAAYLLLKPCEWSARFVLKIIVPEADVISKKMYL